MKVSDLMNNCPVTVTPDTPLRKINLLMHRYHLNSVLVTSDDGKLEGIITYSDLFRQLLPSYEKLMTEEYLLQRPELLEEDTVDLINRPVKEVMTDNVKTIAPDTAAVKAGALMNAHKVKQLPVVDGDKLVGIISFTDITWGLLLKSAQLF